jgi:predicted permease
MLRFVQSFSIILIGLATGAFFNFAIERGFVPVKHGAVERLRAGMQRSVLLAINPVAYCGAIWSLDLSNPRYFLLPMIGIAALGLGLMLGFAGSCAMRLPPERAGVYSTCASFTNIGNIGSLVVFVLLGEPAFALVPFYKLFEEIWYYSTLFPVARNFGEKANPSLASAGGRQGPLGGLLRVARDPFFLVSVAGISAGLGLNASGLSRPVFYTGLNSILVPSSSLIFLFTIGMKMKFRIPREHRRAAALLVVGKTLVVPCAAFALAMILGMGSVAGGLGLKVVLILSMMPVGFLGLVPPTLYRLDADFANSIWLTSNGALALVVPLLAWILPLVG